MNKVLRAAAALQSFCERQDWSFCFIGDLALRTCSAEDLIVMKTFASRTRDWADLEGVLIRQAGRLDWAYVLEHLTPLLVLKGEPGILDRFARLRAQLGA